MGCKGNGFTSKDKVFRAISSTFSGSFRASEIFPGNGARSRGIPGAAGESAGGIGNGFGAILAIRDLSGGFGKTSLTVCQSGRNGILFVDSP